MRFTKMHGAGNDYVIVDAFAQRLPDDPAPLVRAVSDRHLGVGGDGLIFIAPHDGADAEMRMHNADGSYSPMCGNGLRCVAKYLHDRRGVKNNPLRVISAGRAYDLHVSLADGEVESVRVDMGEPRLAPEQVPTTLSATGGRVVDAELVVNGHDFAATALSMGNPHCVLFLPDVSDEIVARFGPRIERHTAFPDRVNVEFVETVARDRVRQRTWERGSGETLACGSGAAAVGVAGALTGRTGRRIVVELLGGELQVEWDEASNHVFLTGPAEEVFTGEWTVRTPSGQASRG